MDPRVHIFRHYPQTNPQYSGFGEELKVRILIVLALLAIPFAAMADTHAEATADISVLIEPYTAIEGLDDMEGLVPQADATVGDTVNGLEFFDVGLTDEFTIYKNTNVDLSAFLVDGGLVNGCDAEPDVMEAEVYFSDNGIDFVLGPVIAQWINCTEEDGEQWWVRVLIERDGLCDHAGLWTGELVVATDTIDCPGATGEGDGECDCECDVVAPGRAG